MIDPSTLQLCHSYGSGGSCSPNLPVTPGVSLSRVSSSVVEESRSPDLELWLSLQRPRDEDHSVCGGRLYVFPLCNLFPDIEHGPADFHDGRKLLDRALFRTIVVTGYEKLSWRLEAAAVV